MEVLVLGNGSSRLEHDELIRSWPGEVWGCNRVYVDYSSILTRVATDSADMLGELHRHRAETGAKFETWAWGKVAEAGADQRFTSPGELRSNSGTMLAMQAAEEGASAALCGFDMGGDDVYLGDLGSKPGWLDKWRNAIDHYGPGRFRFIGHDHMPNLIGRYSMKKVKVKFTNGFQSELNENIAERMQSKGELVILKEEKPEQKKPQRAKKPDVQEGDEPFEFGEAEENR